MSRSAGFTLVETILVVAILLVLAALAVPSFQAMYAEQCVEDAADMVRSSWSLARSRSIEDGVPYRFGVVLGEGQWRVAPDREEYWAGSDAPANKPTNWLTKRDLLPGKVRFQAQDAAQDGMLGEAREAENIDTSEYSRLVTFYPDGSVQAFLPDGTSPDLFHVIVQGKTGYTMRITLRTLTGAVTMKRQPRE